MRIWLTFPIVIKLPTHHGFLEIRRGQRVAVVGPGAQDFRDNMCLEPCVGEWGYLDVVRRHARDVHMACIVIDADPEGDYDQTWTVDAAGSVSEA